MALINTETLKCFAVGFRNKVGESMAAIQTALRAEIKTLSDRHDAEIKKLQDTDAELKIKDNELSSAVSNLQAKDIEIESDITSLQNADTAINAEIDQLKAKDTATDTAIKSLQDKDAEHDSEIVDLQSADTAINTEIGNLKAADTAADSAIKALQAKDTELTAKDTELANSIDELQKQLDGAISTWFEDGVPTLSNAPAKDWTTDELKNEHLKDLYYDNQTGHCYRFSKEGDTYKWILVQDSDTTKLLQDVESLKAKDTTHDSQIKALQTADTTMQGNITALQSADTAIKGDISALQSADTTIKNDISALKTADTGFTNDIASLKAKDTTIDSSISALQKKNTEQDTSISNLQTQATGFTSSIDALKKKDTSIDAEISALKTKDTSLDGQITDINNELAALHQEDSDIRSYVDDKITDLGSDYVKKTGDTMTGTLTMSGSAKIILPNAPTANTDAANKQYVDSMSSKTEVTALQKKVDEVAANSRSVYVGTSNPASTLGKDGDVYIMTSDVDFTFDKTAIDMWTSLLT